MSLQWYKTHFLIIYLIIKLMTMKWMLSYWISETPSCAFTKASTLWHFSLALHRRKTCSRPDCMPRQIGWSSDTSIPDSKILCRARKAVPSHDTLNRCWQFCCWYFWLHSSFRGSTAFLGALCHSVAPVDGIFDLQVKTNVRGQIKH